MDKINYSRDNIIDLIDVGTEAYIYLYRDNKGREVAFKKFKDKYIISNETFLIPERVLRNKEKKLEILSKEECMKDEIKLLDLVYDNDGKFLGFTSVYEPCNSFLDYGLSRKKVKLNLLMQLKEKIIELNKNGIYIGDYNDSNFGVKKGKVKLFDIDNYKVKDLNFDLSTRNINMFLNKCNHPEYLDNYCFNIYSYQFYQGISKYSVHELLEIGKLPKELYNEKNRKLVFSLASPNNNYKPDFLIDNIKKGLF